MSAGAAPVVAEWSGVTPLVPLLLAAAAPSLGCILWLKALRTERVREEHPGPPEPDVDVVISVFIEAGQTADGLADVRSLRFPPRPPSVPDRGRPVDGRPAPAKTPLILEKDVLTGMNRTADPATPSASAGAETGR